MTDLDPPNRGRHPNHDPHGSATPEEFRRIEELETLVREYVPHEDECPSEWAGPNPDCTCRIARVLP